MYPLHYFYNCETNYMKMMTGQEMNIILMTTFDFVLIVNPPQFYKPLLKF